MLTTDLAKHLGEDYPWANYDSKTKNKILRVSTLLFAKQGYAAVSMKDIAREVGIRASSLYNHFKSKKDLWRAVMEHQQALYMIYFERLGEGLQETDSFEQVLEIMFYELKTVVNIFNYYGFSLVMTEQFRDEKASQLFLNGFLDYSIQFLADYFDSCIARGMAKPFDTKTVATLFMHSVLMNNHLRVHEDLGHRVPYDITEMWAAMQQLLLMAST